MHLKEVDANLLVTLDALLVDASVTRAAERLGRSASAISHALAKLREIFNDELFVRAGQRLVPTAKALELAPTVHVILAGMESLLRPSKPFDPSLSVREFAAASSEAGELILVEPLRQRLQSLAPSVRVSWTPLHRDETIDALRNARSHFVIDIEGAPVAAPDVRVGKLFDDTLATLARTGHPFAARKPKAAAFGFRAAKGCPVRASVASVSSNSFPTRTSGAATGAPSISMTKWLRALRSASIVSSRCNGVQLTRTLGASDCSRCRNGSTRISSPASLDAAANSRTESEGSKGLLGRSRLSIPARMTWTVGA